jgi:predicted Ser/Thr protein kinase
MNAAQWDRVRQLFEAALDRDPQTAAEWVAHQADDDPSVRDEVLSLLEHHLRAGEFMSTALADQRPDLLEDDEALQPGAAIGVYTIVRELGRGGMGRVYLATDTRLGRTVALKALAPHLVRDPHQRERLRREARAAAGLAHPGICTVYSLEEADGELYIVTEYVDGETLGEEIRRGVRPSPDDLFRTGRDLAAALAAAHAAGIVHRDLKPDNVMRARDGRLKILDFGLARSQSGVGASFATRPGMLMGTPGYIAPEQLAGERGDARADVYAYGVLMYEYACGTHPFATGAPRTVPGIGGIIARCLRQSPDERFASGGEIAAALDGAAGAAGIQPRHTIWWRTHQVIVIALYVTGSALAWQIKDWMEQPVTVSIFVALGAAATIGGVFRGHLMFTELMNPATLASEQRRASRVTTLVDLLFAALLLVDGLLIAQRRALPGVFTVSLAIGIALAALVLEPATTRAAFGEQNDRH